MPRKLQKLTWIPVHLTRREGRKITLAGNARARLSDKIIARKSVDVKDLNGKPVGKFDTITNDNGALDIRNKWDPFDKQPCPEVSTTCHLGTSIGVPGPNGISREPG